MKRTLLQGVVLIVVVGLVWVAGEWYGAHKTAAPVADARILHPAPPTPPALNAPSTQTAPPVAQKPPAFMGPNEWPQYRDAREAALKANPDLVTEYKGILKKMDAQQAKMDAAMLKADPKMKPVMDKLVALRQRNTSPLERSATDKPAPMGPSIKLTPEDMQELRTARTQALQTNPDLMANAKTLADQMRAFQGKLDAAMIKADPNVSPLIAKFEGGRKAPEAAPAPQPAK